MKYGIVPTKFISLENNGLEIAKIPESTDVKVMTQNLHWLQSVGSQLIPFNYSSGSEFSWVSGTINSEFYLRPKAQGLDRIWVFRVRGSGSGVAVFTFKFANSSLVETRATNVDGFAFVRETGFAASSEPVIVALTATCNTTGSIVSYGCFELPRAILQSGSDGGIDDTLFNPRLQIESSGTTSGLKALASGISSSIGSVRTAGIFNWSRITMLSGWNVHHSFSGAVAEPPIHFSTFSASLRLRRMGMNLNQRTTGTAEYAVLLYAPGDLCTASVVFHTMAGITSFTASHPYGWKWYSGSLPILVDGTSSANYALPPGRSRSDFFGMTIEDMGFNIHPMYCYSISIGERDIGIPE